MTTGESSMLPATRDATMATTQIGDYTAEMAACANAIGLEAPAVVQPEDRWVDLNGITFHYLDWGNPHLPRLVLLHGGSLTAHTWDMAALLLRDRYHIVALDQRGHGDTGWTPDDQRDTDSMELMLEDTRLFIEHLGYDHFILCGMSMGGINSMRYTARYPERVDALVVVDVAPVMEMQGAIEMEQFRRDSEIMRRFEDFLDRAVQFNPHRRREHLRYSLLHSLKQVPDGWTWKQDPGRLPDEDQSEDEKQAAREKRTVALLADVQQIRVPTLLMRGEISKILSEAGAAHMAANMADCEVVVIPGATHNVQGDNPAHFAHALDGFVQRRVFA